jgi:hypothetical protein
MTTTTASATTTVSATRPLARTSRRLTAPTRVELIDAGFVAVLCGSALTGLRSSYPGWTFLAVGLVGLLLGLAVSWLIGAVTRSLIAVAVAAVAAYFLGGPLVLTRGQVSGSVLPTVPLIRSLSSASVGGWKQLLTTQPPVDNTQIFLAVPYILGLAGAVLGLTIARRSRWAAAPLAAPVAVLAAVIALGTRQPTAWALTGIAFSVLLLVWAGVRAHRARPVSADGSASGDAARRLRALTGIAALVVAAGGAAAVEPLLPGAGGDHRAVLRDHITPPVDLSAYASPLAGFRKYTADAHEVWDQTLMTVTGLPPGVPIQIATLDDYNGSVWGASNGTGGDAFLRVGSTVATDAVGRTATVHITIAPAYAEATDTNVWLPTAGSITAVSFVGADATALSTGLRYNLATASAIVPGGLQSGDSFTLRTVIDEPTLPADAQPFGPPDLTDGFQSVFAERAAVWDRGSVGISAQLQAIATYLRDNGAYSDGGPGETEYLPGHSIGRLTTFLDGPQPVGDDEQYAAAYALMANSLGMPARVVLGAIPEADGTVRGADVHAWVQFHIASGAWVSVPDSQFVPATSKTPAPQPPQRAQDADATVVPPPSAVHPPTTANGGGANGSASQNHGPVAHGPASAWISAVLTVLAWIGSPLLAILLVFGSICGCKARRRKLRRTRGTPANRFAAGWLELIDHARDLGIAVPSGITRQQQARRLADEALAGLARTADAAVYGPGDPTPEHALTFWQHVDDARRDLSRRSRRRQRLRAALDIRTLRPAVLVGLVGFSRGGAE